MVDEYGAVGGMRGGRETDELGGNLPQCQVSIKKSHIT
jgi:hypothetical protein